MGHKVCLLKSNCAPPDTLNVHFYEDAASFSMVIYRLSSNNVSYAYQINKFFAALTHTSRPYCDLKTIKIAFFFQISKFLSQTVRGSAVLCSVRFLYVLNTTLLRPWRFHCHYIASPRRPHGDHRRPRCDCATFSASLRRLFGDYCVYPATVLRLYDDPTTSLLRQGCSKDVVRTQ